MLKHRKENQLLYAGVGIFFSTLILYGLVTYYWPDVTPPASRLNLFDGNILLIMLSALVLAPILEEVIFRGLFLKRLFFSLCFYGGSLLMILYTENYYLLILLLAVFLVDYHFKAIRCVYILNAILFALIHYKLSDFASLLDVIPVFFQLSLGLILIWITLNFGLKRSMLAHFGVNFLIFMPFFILLQFPDKKQEHITLDHHDFKWQKTSVLGPSKISYSPQRVSAERLSIQDFINLFEDRKLHLEISDSLRFFRYDFELEQHKGPIDKAVLEDLLIKSKLASPSVQN
ncbi:CPBP family intramembrane glutamic endopeptidase [Chryseobacterium sp. T1]